MSWKKKLKLNIDLLQQTINLFEKGENQLLQFSLDELKEYTSSEEFILLSEQDKKHEMILMLKRNLSMCNDAVHKYIKRAGKFREVNEEEAKNILIKDYFNSIDNGDDEVPSMNINDWVEQMGIIIFDDVSSSTKE